MIDKREILDQSAATGLNPHIVEKDYVLGWLLWGVANHDAIAESWLFKGGTCLKKCFFETYRFSEDLDFTLTDAAHLDEDFLRKVFADVATAVYDHTGIEIPTNAQRFDVYANSRGHPSCQARIPYRGPVSPPSMPRIKFDLTADELIVLPPVRLRVFHPYSDEPPEGITVSSYAYEEAFAEKTRALSERARPRDLYDVVNLFRRVEARPQPAVLFDVLRRKCKFKGVEPPAYNRLEPSRSLIESSWGQMLGHQLHMLPPFDSFWEELPTFLAWLETGQPPPAPAPLTSVPGDEVVRARLVHLPTSIPLHARASLQAHLDIIRFAASNRLCVDLVYQSSTRRIEPYSLRRTKEGNVILHAHNRDKGVHRSYRLDRIQGARVTNESFTPRFAIELTPSGPVSVPPTTPHPPSTRAPRRRSAGPTYVYECGFLQKTVLPQDPHEPAQQTQGQDRLSVSRPLGPLRRYALLTIAAAVQLRPRHTNIRRTSVPWPNAAVTRKGIGPLLVRNRRLGLCDVVFSSRCSKNAGTAYSTCDTFGTRASHPASRQAITAWDEASSRLRPPVVLEQDEEDVLVVESFAVPLAGGGASVDGEAHRLVLAGGFHDVPRKNVRRSGRRSVRGGHRERCGR